MALIVLGFGATSPLNLRLKASNLNSKTRRHREALLAGSVKSHEAHYYSGLKLQIEFRDLRQLRLQRYHQHVGDLPSQGIDAW
jgi:hypothetical protein